MSIGFVFCDSLSLPDVLLLYTDRFTMYIHILVIQMYEWM